MKTKPASMKVEKQTEQIKIHKCGECSHPCWNSDNLDYKGHIFIGRCKFSKFGRITYAGGIVYIDTPSCEYFQRKEKL